MGRSLPVPRREDAVVQRQRRRGPLLLLRLPGQSETPSASYERSSTSTSRRRCASWPIGPGSRCTRTRRPEPTTGVEHNSWRRWSAPCPGTTSGSSRRRTPGRRGTTCARGLRRRGGAAVPAGMGARGLGRAERLARGYRPACSNRAGLAFVNRRGPAQDAFRGAGLVPHLRPVRPPSPWGASARPGAAAGTVPESPSTRTRPRRPIYAKRRTLYALNWAKHDVIAIGRGRGLRGVHRRHRLLPRRGSLAPWRRAGRRWPRTTSDCSATSHAASSSPTTPTPPARPRWAASTSGSGATRSTWRWPHCLRGSDPGQLAQEDPEALRQALAGARPFLQFRVDRALLGRPLDAGGSGQGGRSGRST